AQALGRASGRIETGAIADLVSLKADHPALATHDGDAILNAWIFVGGCRLVDCVWSAGVKQVSNGHHSRRGGIAQSFREAMRRMHTQVPLSLSSFSDLKPSSPHLM